MIISFSASTWTVRQTHRQTDKQTHEQKENNTSFFTDITGVKVKTKFTSESKKKLSCRDTPSHLTSLEISYVKPAV